MPVTLGSKTLQMAIPEAPVSKSWNRYGENNFFCNIDLPQRQ